MSNEWCTELHNVLTCNGKLLNVEQIFIENSFKSKLKIIKELGCTLDIVGSPQPIV
jgi:hypothetical protein